MATFRMSERFTHPFGKNLSAYSTAIGDMKPEVVVASANAAQALSNLATGLPDSSLFDQWFGGDQTLATFGNDIAAFGASMGNYYVKVAEIDISKMNGIVAAVWKLVDLAKGAKEVDKNSFSNFKASLASLADSGLDGFLGSFTNSETKINSAILTMMGNLSASITRNKWPERTAGYQLLLHDGRCSGTV